MKSVMGLEVQRVSGFGLLLAGFLILFFPPGLFQAGAGLPTPWRYQGTYPTGASLLAVWSAGPEDVFAGGDGGVIMRWNGAEWLAMDTPTQKTIYAIHGTSASDVWAVGGDAYTQDQSDRSLILHYDGTAWSERTPPDYVGYTYTLGTVYAVSSTEAWALPSSGNLIARYNGTAWTFEDFIPGTEGHLYAITHVAPDHLYVTGSHGQILHRTAGTWTLERKTESGFVSQNLVQTVWGLNASTVYAGDNFGALYRRGSGGTWVAQGVAGGACGIQAIVGASATEIELVGPRCLQVFNGSTITETEDFTGAIRADWQTASLSGGRLYAVGTSSVVHELTRGPDGARRPMPLTVGQDRTLEHVTLGCTPFGDEELLVYGSSVSRPSAHALYRVEEGGVIPWTNRPPEMLQQTRIMAASATGPDDLIISWDSIRTPIRLGVHHWNGGEWTQLKDGLGNSILNVRCFWRSPAGTLFAADSLRLLRIDSNFVAEPLATLPSSLWSTVQFNSLTGASDSHIYLGANDGRIFRYDGNDFLEESTPGGSVVTHILAHQGEAYAVGEGGQAWSRTAGSWTQMAGVELRFRDDFNGLAVGSNGVYATQTTDFGISGGGSGRIWRFTGGGAQAVAMGVTGSPGYVTRTGDGYLTAIASHGAAITTRPLPANFTMVRMRLDDPGWQAIGDTGVAVQFEVQGGDPAGPVMCAWTKAEPALGWDRLNETPSELGPDYTWVPLQKEVAVGIDVPPDGSKVPPAKIQITTTEAEETAPVVPTALHILREDGDDWMSEEAVTHEAVVASQIVRTTQTLHPQTGFSTWTLAAASPKIFVEQTPAGMVASWAASATGYVLQVAGRPGRTGWAKVPGVPTQVGDRVQQPVPGHLDAEFFRLVIP